MKDTFKISYDNISIVFLEWSSSSKCFFLINLKILRTHDKIVISPTVHRKFKIFNYVTCE